MLWNFLNSSDRSKYFRFSSSPDAKAFLPSLVIRYFPLKGVSISPALSKYVLAHATRLSNLLCFPLGSISPRLVVSLLLHMGYGNGITEAGMVTQQSNDGGIDGIIKEDQLGFSSIYIQAKQWATDQTVGKPEIQKFVGALQGQQAQKGLFITTAKFSSGALQYANNLLGTKIVLVDGLTLTRLMIKHNVGVSVEHIYEVNPVPISHMKQQTDYQLFKFF